MIIFLQLNVPLGLPPGKYLFEEDALSIFPTMIKQILESAGQIVMRDATREEEKLFNINRSHGIGYTCLEAFKPEERNELPRS